ncbi:hypothetical protein HAX54_050831, partial [Datura stramonium]|nr:hypothetical protein [Datura stramonium]
MEEVAPHQGSEGPSLAPSKLGSPISKPVIVGITWEDFYNLLFKNDSGDDRPSGLQRPINLAAR